MGVWPTESEIHEIFAYQRGGGGGAVVKQVMGIKQCPCGDERWVTCGSAKSLNCTLETNTTLYAK